MPYELPIAAKFSSSGRFIMSTLEVLQQAFVDSGMSEQEIADKLEVDVSYVVRVLHGEENLTLRVLGEFACALDCKPNFSMDKK